MAISAAKAAFPIGRYGTAEAVPLNAKAKCGDPSLRSG
jgi:hypothetical protein